MSLAGYAFVKGFTGDVRNSIEKREEEDKDRKKSVFLEELRRDTIKWNADLEESYAAKRPDKDMSEDDYSTGERILRNRNGDEIGRTKLSASAVEEYGLDRRGKLADVGFKETKARYADEDARLGLDATRAQIESSRASADSSRASASRSRQGASLDRVAAPAAGGSDTVTTAAAELRYQNSSAITAAEKAGVPPTTINRIALAIANQGALEKSKGRALSGTQANTIFLQQLEAQMLNAPKTTAGKALSGGL